MSYHWELIFRCCMCGKTEPTTRWVDMPFGWKTLPEGWTGSIRKRGECYCDECTNAIQRIKGEASE